MPAVSSPSTVLVTGATGYLASYIAKELLDAGFTVIGTVRRASGGEYLSQMFNERFSFVIVEDMSTPDALTSLMHRVDLVVHTTNPTRFPNRPYDPQLIIRASVQATVNVLNSAAAPGSKVQRVVFTGSIASITNIDEPKAANELTDAHWNDEDLREVESRGSGATDHTVYSVGKLLAERAANDFIARNAVSFDIVHVLPYYVYGPFVHDVQSTDAISGGSLMRIWDLFEHPEQHSPEEYFAGFVDVRDVARAHIDAATRQDLSGMRVLNTSQHCLVVQDVYDAYYAIPEAERPKLPFDVPRGNPGLGDALRQSFPKFSRASQDKLGWELRGLVECVRDTLQSFLDKGLA